MIFETLWESAQRNELVLVEGGLCRWHLRKDGQITIREIIVLPERQGQGIGTEFLTKLRQIESAKSIYSKCPADLAANNWYQSKGFYLVGTEKTKTGRRMNCWELNL